MPPTREREAFASVLSLSAQAALPPVIVAVAGLQRALFAMCVAAC
jgi:hypothetical protein